MHHSQASAVAIRTERESKVASFFVKLQHKGLRVCGPTADRNRSSQSGHQSQTASSQAGPNHLSQRVSRGVAGNNTIQITTPYPICQQESK